MIGCVKQQVRNFWGVGGGLRWGGVGAWRFIGCRAPSARPSLRPSVCSVGAVRWKQFSAMSKQQRFSQSCVWNECGWEFQSSSTGSLIIDFRQGESIGVTKADCYFFFFQSLNNRSRAIVASLSERHVVWSRRVIRFSGCCYCFILLVDE